MLAKLHTGFVCTDKYYPIIYNVCDTLVLSDFHTQTSKAFALLGITVPEYLITLDLYRIIHNKCTQFGMFKHVVMANCILLTNVVAQL